MKPNLFSLKPAKNLTQIEHRLGVSLSTIYEFCQKWSITELALFGSILRDDFNSESDIDFLVTFAPDKKIGMFELFKLEDELKTIVKRDIDLVFKSSVETSHNWIRKRQILKTIEVIYGI